jgi:translation initiation factor IF-2
MMKKRLYTLAKELNISKDEILNIVKNLGLDIKGYLGNVSDEDEQKIRNFVKKEEEIKEENIEVEKDLIEETPEEEILEIYVAPQPSALKKKKKKEKKKIDEKEIERRIKETKAKLEGKRKKYKKKKFADNIEIDEETLKIPSSLTVSELAEVLEVEPNTIILKCLELGLPVTLNQRLDFETISLLAEDYGLKVELYEEFLL